MRHWLVLFLALGADSLSAQQRRPFTWSGCYTFAWPASVGKTLPDSIRLLTRRDPKVRRPAPAMFFAHPISSGPDSGIGWIGIQGAWWMPFDTDSFTLTLTTSDEAWSATFTVQADSVHGAVTWYVGDGFGGPYDMRGVRIPCPP